PPPPTVPPPNVLATRRRGRKAPRDRLSIPPQRRHPPHTERLPSKHVARGTSFKDPHLTCAAKWPPAVGASWILLMSSRLCWLGSVLRSVRRSERSEERRVGKEGSVRGGG